MRRQEFALNLAAVIFFITAFSLIVCGLYLVVLGIFAKDGDITRSLVWGVLELIIGAVKLVIPNVVEGMAPTVDSVPAWWTRFTYFHAFTVLLLIGFGIFVLRVRLGLYKRKRKKPARIMAMALSTFFAIYFLFLLILWSGGQHGALMFVICFALIVIFTFITLFLNTKKAEDLFATQDV